MYSESITIQRHGRRIDEKGHIVGDDLDDRVGGLPTMFFELWIVDPDLCFAR